MSDYNENQSHLMTRMDDAFCARMRAAIAAGLESAPIGIITTPGTQSPRYVPAEPRLPASPSGNLADLHSLGAALAQKLQNVMAVHGTLLVLATGAQEVIRL